jgi:hypothetical protein
VSHALAAASLNGIVARRFQKCVAAAMDATPANASARVIVVASSSRIDRTRTPATMDDAGD